MIPNTPSPFEATSAYVYHAARYELLPRIVEIARDSGDEPFRLKDIFQPLLAETYTTEQLEIQIKRKESDKTLSVRQSFAHYIPFLAKKLKLFDWLGGGMFKNISIEEELAEADAEDDDVESDDSGTIYAYSFPSIIRNDGRFPIKVGKTVKEDAESRITQQCKQTCCFENPKVLKTWEVQRVAAVEHAIHSTLEARGSKRQAPGREWFDTTLVEIETIVNFVQSAIPNNGPA